MEWIGGMLTNTRFINVLCIRITECLLRIKIAVIKARWQAPKQRAHIMFGSDALQHGLGDL